MKRKSKVKLVIQLIAAAIVVIAIRKVHLSLKVRVIIFYLKKKWKYQGKFRFLRDFSIKRV